MLNLQSRMAGQLCANLQLHVFAGSQKGSIERIEQGIRESDLQSQPFA